MRLDFWWWYPRFPTIRRRAALSLARVRGLHDPGRGARASAGGAVHDDRQRLAVGVGGGGLRALARLAVLRGARDQRGTGVSWLDLAGLGQHLGGAHPFI